MPDLTIELMQQCTRWKCDSPKWAAQGGCWPYRKSKKGYEYGTCKHVCQWHEQWSDEAQTEKQREDMVCPRCSAETEWVRVGV